jgi:hypothetical protein
MVTIGQYTFDVPPPLGMRSFALQQRILPVAGRIVGVLLSVMGKASSGFDMKKLGEVDIVPFLPIAMPALGEVFGAMPPGELEALTRELLSDAKVHGWGGAKSGIALFGKGNGPDTFDSVMQGRAVDTWQLLWHGLKVWYPDFFSLAAAKNGGVRRENGLGASST